MKLRILLAWALLALLVPCQVMADELWVQNQGGLEIVVEYTGDISITADSGIYLVNPDYGDGTAKACAADITNGWVCITADSITGYTIEVACNQSFEDVSPEVRWVKDAPQDYTSANQGSSDAKAEPTYDFPDPYWLYT